MSARKNGWRYRVFRFLDRSILDTESFKTRIDAGYMKTWVLQLLEFHVRKTAYTGVLHEGSCLSCSIGYGFEVLFGGDDLPPAEKAYNFDEGVSAESPDIRFELNGSRSRWGLPFERFEVFWKAADRFKEPIANSSKRALRYSICRI